MENTNFKYSLAIPVPMGAKVYHFMSDCCDACLYKNAGNSHLFKCDFNAPCHTKIFSICEETLTFDNLGRILQDWGTAFFATREEAEIASQSLIEAHRKIMRENGFEIAEDGSLRKD